MATNTQSQFSADVENYIADKTLPLARRQVCAYGLGDKLTLEKGRGLTYTATRFNRLPLPFAPLSEGVPPVGEQMGLSQVSATAQQWGDKVTITDVAEMTIKHPLFQQAIELTGLQIAETLDRNTFNALNAMTQVNYVNQRGSRAALVAGDVLDPHTVNRTTATLKTLGAPRYNGDEQTDEELTKNDAGRRQRPAVAPHYIGLCHTLVVGDFSENPTVVQAWSYSDIDHLYNYEAGQWRGIRFLDSNMVPTWTGAALVTGTPSGTGGTLAANTYFIVVTGSDTQNQYESIICQPSAGLVVSANTGSISVTVPNTVGYTWNIYIGTSNTPINLAAIATGGPQVGPYTGQAVQIAGGATVVIQSIGIAQTPPAAPATGVQVFPTYIIGRGLYGQVKLDDVRFTYLKDADKSDPLNQLRIVGWKAFYGTILQNNQFGARIESASKFTTIFG